jgi:hypothetical protein
VWAQKATIAPRPLSDLLCIRIYFIAPAVPYLWKSTISYIRIPSLWFGSIEIFMIPKRRNLIYLKRCVRLFLLPCDTSHNQSCQLKSLYYRSLLVAFTIFSCRFLVVHTSPTRTQELNRHHQQSPMRVHRTGCCPVPRRDRLRHCCTFGTMLVDQSLFSILDVTSSPR